MRRGPLRVSAHTYRLAWPLPLHPSSGRVSRLRPCPGPRTALVSGTPSLEQDPGPPSECAGPCGCFWNKAEGHNWEPLIQRLILVISVTETHQCGAPALAGVWGSGDWGCPSPPSCVVRCYQAPAPALPPTGHVTGASLSFFIKEGRAQSSSDPRHPNSGADYSWGPSLLPTQEANPQPRTRTQEGPKGPGGGVWGRPWHWPWQGSRTPSAGEASRSCVSRDTRLPFRMLRG